MTRSLLPDDIIEGRTPIASLPAVEVKKAKRAAPGAVATYHKALTLKMTKARYVRFRSYLAQHDRMAQELLTELVDKWMDEMDASAAQEKKPRKPRSPSTAGGKLTPP